MTNSSDDELVAQLRRSLGSEVVTNDAASDDPPINDDIPPVAERAERMASPAAMAIADQIVGLDGVIAGAEPSGSSIRMRSEDGAATTFESECTIGRQGGDGRLIVPDGRVSRSHALLMNDRGRATVRDLGSSNGTYLVRDGTSERVGAEPVQLRVGDRIETVGGLLLAEVIEVGL